MASPLQAVDKGGDNPYLTALCGEGGQQIILERSLEQLLMEKAGPH